MHKIYQSISYEGGFYDTSLFEENEDFMTLFIETTIDQKLLSDNGLQMIQ